MNFEQMSETLQRIIMKAVELCKERKHITIDTIHLLKVLFEDEILDGLYRRVGINKKEALTIVNDELDKIARSEGEPRFSNEVVKSFEKAKNGVMNMKRHILDVHHYGLH